MLYYIVSFLNHIQRVIESRNMLKKTILEAPPTENLSNENAPTTIDNTNVNSILGLSSNKKPPANRDSAQKLLSPSSQQDTTTDSSIRTYTNDGTKPVSSFQKKDIPHLTLQNQLEASINDKLQNKIKELIQDNVSPRQ